MAKLKQEGVTGAAYERMCARMIEMANRGVVANQIVKTIAKAGDVKPVMDYILKFHKLFAKFNAEKPTREPAAKGSKPARRGKRGKRGAQPSGEEAAA